MTEFDRTSPEYFNRVMSQTDSGFGLIVEQPLPETFEELKNLVDSRSHSDCDTSRGIDEIMEMIAADSNRDQITRLLPYHIGSKALMFVVPNFINEGEMNG